jgi:hypothetical protein
MLYTFKASLTTVLLVLYALALAVAESPIVRQCARHRLKSNALFEGSRSGLFV